MQIDLELTNMRSRETRSTHSRMQALFSRIYIGLVIYSLDYNILILDLAIQVRREERNVYRYTKTREKIQVYSFWFSNSDAICRQEESIFIYLHSWREMS